MKYFFKRILPSPDKLKGNRFLRPLLCRMEHSRMWQVNRRSIAGGVASGLFFGSLPIPIQIPCAVAVAILARVNVAVAAISTLYSNPLTMGPLFYFNYRIGVWLFGGGVPDKVDFELNGFMQLGGRILMPLFSGSVAVGLVIATIGYFVVLFSWRWTLVIHYKRRAERKIAALRKIEDSK